MFASEEKTEVESTDSQISPIQKRIQDLEGKYKELLENLQSSKQKVVDNERALLECMTSLMPLQNAYLGGIIKALQKKIVDLSVDKDTTTDKIDDVQSRVHAAPVPRVRSRKVRVPDTIKEEFE